MQSLFANISVEDKLWRKQRVDIAIRAKMLALTDEIVIKTWAGDHIGAQAALKQQKRLFASIRRES